MLRSFFCHGVDQGCAGERLSVRGRGGGFPDGVDGVHITCLWAKLVGDAQGADEQGRLVADFILEHMKR